MNAKLLIASLVLGTSTLAAAAPAAQFYPARPVVTQPVAWHRAVTLASGLRMQDGRAVISVGREVGRFATLQLAADGGRTYVEKVVVKFANGERQVMDNLNRTLVGDERLTLDLNGNRRAIASIAVFGQQVNRGFRFHRGGAISLTAS